MECANQGSTQVSVPISPGLWQEVSIVDYQRIALDETISINGVGILGLDGDRSISLGKSESVVLRVRRDGPWIIEPDLVMRMASAKGLLSSNS